MRLVTKPRYIVRLSQAELIYLQKVGAVPDKIKVFFDRFGQKSTGPYSIRISRSLAERIRGALTEHLASIGFDADYNLNEDGKVAEDLIDKFLVE